MSGPWERRWHPLLDEWVIISSSSAARPWSGARSDGSATKSAKHDPSCYLCAGVTRANGAVNPQYTGPFAFDNDFPTFAATAPTPSDGVESAPDEQRLAADPFAITAASRGQCRVLCWSERHDMTLADLPPEAMDAVARLWQSEFKTIAANPEVKQALLFENKGVEIGVSNLHPHGQAYGLPFVSSHARRMRTAQARYAKAQNSSLLVDMLQHTSVTDLLVEKTAHWSVIVPFAARFAYETWIIPNSHVTNIAGLSDKALLELGRVYHRQAQRYDALFRRQSPNITHFHNAPSDSHPDNTHWCFHIGFQPPLREPDKLKYLGGFESAAGNITNPVQPEIAASRLRDLNITE